MFTDTDFFRETYWKRKPVRIIRITVITPRYWSDADQTLTKHFIVLKVKFPVAYDVVYIVNVPWSEMTKLCMTLNCVISPKKLRNPSIHQKSKCCMISEDLNVDSSVYRKVAWSQWCPAERARGMDAVRCRCLWLMLVSMVTSQEWHVTLDQRPWRTARDAR